MNNSNNLNALLLVSIQLFTSTLIAIFTLEYFPNDLSKRVHLLLSDLLSIINKDGWETIKYDIEELFNASWFYVWSITSILAGSLVAFALQLYINGIQPKWRYYLGAFLMFFSWFLTFKLFAVIKLYFLGKVLGFLIGLYLGWLSIVYTKKIAINQSDINKLTEHSEPVKFDVIKYINLKKGIFIGLSKTGKPCYLTLEDGRKHIQIIGETRYGKTVLATLLQTQAAMLKECVLIFDPKSDRYCPMTLKAAAERANVPFIYINISPDQPAQLNILSGAEAYELEELLISCFNLTEKDSEGDIYRLADRNAVRKLAKSQVLSLADLIHVGMQDKSIFGAKKLWEGLDELASHPVIQTSGGWKLDELVGKPSIIYISGSKTHDNTIRLQKLIFLRVLQLIDKYGLKDGANYTSLYADEFKYLLCPSAMRALGTVADRNCHLTIVHQSLQDLNDCGGMDPNAVYGAVVVNTGLKFLFRTLDPETAKWGSEMSGDVRSFTESHSKDLSKYSSGSFYEIQRPLIEKNVLLSLPKMSCIAYGAGIAKQVSVYYMPSSDSPASVTAAESEILNTVYDGVI